MLKASATEDAAPRTMRETIQRKFLDEIIGCSSKLSMYYFFSGLQPEDSLL